MQLQNHSKLQRLNFFFFFFTQILLGQLPKFLDNSFFFFSLAASQMKHFWLLKKVQTYQLGNTLWFGELNGNRQPADCSDKVGIEVSDLLHISQTERDFK